MPNRERGRLSANRARTALPSMQQVMQLDVSKVLAMKPPRAGHAFVPFVRALLDGEAQTPHRMLPEVDDRGKRSDGRLRKPTAH
jgi:hypothetical protein